MVKELVREAGEKEDGVTNIEMKKFLSLSKREWGIPTFMWSFCKAVEDLPESEEVPVAIREGIKDALVLSIKEIIDGFLDTSFGSQSELDHDALRVFSMAADDLVAQALFEIIGERNRIYSIRTTYFQVKKLMETLSDDLKQIGRAHV